MESPKVHICQRWPKLVLYACVNDYKYPQTVRTVLLSCVWMLQSRKHKTISHSCSGCYPKSALPCCLECWDVNHPYTKRNFTRYASLHPRKYVKPFFLETFFKTFHIFMGSFSRLDFCTYCAHPLLCQLGPERACWPNCYASGIGFKPTCPRRAGLPKQGIGTISAKV